MLALRSKKKELDLNEKNFREIKNLKDKYILEGEGAACYLFSYLFCSRFIVIRIPKHADVCAKKKEIKPDLILFQKNISGICYKSYTLRG
jgi:hypothetical protein